MAIIFLLIGLHNQGGTILCLNLREFESICAHNNSGIVFAIPGHQHAVLWWPHGGGSCGEVEPTQKNRSTSSAAGRISAQMVT